MTVWPGSARRTQMPRVLQNASKQRGQRVVRLLSSWCLRSKVRLIVITSVSLLRIVDMEKAHCLDSEESRWWALKSCSKFSTLFVLDAWWSWNTPRSVGSFTHTVIGLSATPPSLWPGRELRKYHHYVRGNEYSVFKVRLTVSGFPPHLGCCPCCDHSVSES